MEYKTKDKIICIYMNTLWMKKDQIIVGSKNWIRMGLPAGPVKTLPFNAGTECLTPHWGVKIPHASWSQSKNVKWNKFS